MPVDSHSNEIQFIGNFANEEVYFAFSAMHRIIDVQMYKDISLNFSKCEKAYSAAMLPICAFCIKLWKLGIDVHLELPIHSRLKSLFLATNWAHFIDYRQWAESRNRGFTHSPAIRFASGADQNKAVNKGMDVVLAAVQHLSRDELRYLEWVLTELTDNVINHAESLCGGLLQITNHRDRKEVEFVVSDAGLGIPATLKPSLNVGYSDAEVLYRAIQENVTRDKSIGQGNGLYGSWRIAQISGGQFSIFSGYGRLSSPEKGDIRSSTTKIPFSGTTVQARLGYDRGVDLSEAMVFPGKTFAPVDYLETHFAEDENGDITFVLSEESDGFGSRAAARPVRRKLENLIRQTGVGTVHVDLGSINLVSSSYADELFGKLFIILGPMNFMQRIKLKRVDSLVMGLIDRAITQRSMQGFDKASEIES